MCMKILDKMLWVSRKKCKAESCKSKIEGIMIGILIGSVGGIVVGMMANSDKCRELRDKMLYECIDGKCRKKSIDEICSGKECR